jgi:hypothetical protein
MKKYIVLIVVTVLSSLQLDAQSPQGFNYHHSVFTINGAYNQPNINFPQKDGMWLKAGDIIGSTTGSYGDSYNITISIIEYNIISE